MKYTHLFFDDYSEGAHPRILEALSRTALQQERGYGTDSFTKEAARLIQEKTANSKASVHFISSGTHANLTCLASMLKPYESVIAAESGHTNVHEAGAVEATGHKINVALGTEGKLAPESVQAIVDWHTNEQMVKPRVVYISQSTEFGTIYSKQELEALSAVCKRNHLYFYIDGARIGNAVMAASADASLRDIAALCDMFYIGGTKNGGLMGEAIVIPNPHLQENFRYHLRQRGALLAKARSISIQFVEFFKDTLYFDNAKHANDMAQKLTIGIRNLGYSFWVPPSTNQIFPILPNTLIKKLSERYGFYTWAAADAAPESSIVRLVTSWATPEKAVREFLNDLKNLQ